MLRNVLLFTHVISAMGLFTALGMEALALTQLRRASDSAAARAALAGLESTRRISGPSAGLLLLTGISLAAYWRGQGAWMGLGLAGLVAVGAIGGVLTGRRVGGLEKKLGEGVMGTALTDALPALRTSLVLRGALLTAVVYLMTARPGPVGSLSALGAAVVVGLVLSRTRRRAESLQATRAEG